MPKEQSRSERTQAEKLLDAANGFVRGAGIGAGLGMLNAQPPTLPNIAWEAVKGGFRGGMIGGFVGYNRGDVVDYDEVAREVSPVASAVAEAVVDGVTGTKGTDELAHLDPGLSPRDAGEIGMRSEQIDSAQRDVPLDAPEMAMAEAAMRDRVDLQEDGITVPPRQEGLFAGPDDAEPDPQIGVMPAPRPDLSDLVQPDEDPRGIPSVSDGTTPEGVDPDVLLDGNGEPIDPGEVVEQGRPWHIADLFGIDPDQETLSGGPAEARFSGETTEYDSEVDGVGKVTLKATTGSSKQDPNDSGIGDGSYVGHSISRALSGEEQAAVDNAAAG